MGDDYTGPVTVAVRRPEEEAEIKKVLADKDVWGNSETITEMVKDTDPGDTIPLVTVDEEALDKVVEYMEIIAGYRKSEATEAATKKKAKEARETLNKLESLPLEELKGVLSKHNVNFEEVIEGDPILLARKELTDVIGAVNELPPLDLTKISDYIGSLESPEKQHLLFKTMNAALYLNVETLLNNLCNLVAGMIAQRTPNEILDYFNIKKDATWEEEKALIDAHEWIDPEGLIKAAREATGTAGGTSE